MTSAEDTMTNTMDYRTKSIAHEVKNVSVENAWPIAMDIGYSSVKCFSPIMICAFPFYAKNLGKNPQLFGEQEAVEYDEIDVDRTVTGKPERYGGLDVVLSRW